MPLRIHHGDFAQWYPASRSQFLPGHPKIGLSADISKMFHEVLLHPGDRDLHRFILRDEAGCLVYCRIIRLTFGITSLPFAATQVLHILANSHVLSHAVASKAILSDFMLMIFWWELILSKKQTIWEPNSVTCCPRLAWLTWQCPDWGYFLIRMQGKKLKIGFEYTARDDS